MGKDATPYEVLVDERVEKDLEKVPKYVVEKFLKLLDEFEKNPIRPRSGFDVKPMEGYPSNTYRLRIGKYRVIPPRPYPSARARWQEPQQSLLISS